MTTVLAFDPGGCTGVVAGAWTDSEPFRVTGQWAVQGGAQGLADFLVEYLQYRPHPDVVISERFIPDGTAGGRETVSPQGEGVLIAHFGRRIHWQLRSEKSWGYGGEGARQKADQKLKEAGFWVEGSDVNWEDGRDVNDAILHAIQYLRKARHRPTLKLLWAK